MTMSRLIVHGFTISLNGYGAQVAPSFQLLSVTRSAIR